MTITEAQKYCLDNNKSIVVHSGKIVGFTYQEDWL